LGSQRDVYLRINISVKSNAIGMLSSIVIGVASTAPAYSLAVTLGLIVVVAGVGFKSPAIMIVSFVPMILIASTYYYLNKADPDCGTTFSWVSRAIGPRTGWVMVAADIIVMASLARITGTYFFLLIGAHGLANSLFNNALPRRCTTPSAPSRSTPLPTMPSLPRSTC
jgi:amino acid transporter